MKWEYKILTERESPIYDFSMNKLGEDGWELVSVVAVQICGRSPKAMVRMYFKRLKNGVNEKSQCTHPRGFERTEMGNDEHNFLCPDCGMGESDAKQEAD